ncbi:MAG: FtsK/SpoIIIE domain-containing protein [Lachnospiraceae bacterium]|nr:FtsK/SpoIIIE domain-containing protein [Ruminococcus sp.]MCM1274538.1 FtsK/SpoIIIE domain-containing protein [Lachnospiraceae bacterium]
MAERKTTTRGTVKSAGSTGKTKSSSAAKSRSKKAAELEAQRIREEALRRNQRRRNICSVILLAAGILLTLLALIEGSMGWKALHDVMHGLFGFAAYAVGPLMIYAAVVISSGKPNNTIAFTMFKVTLFVVMLCAAVEIFSVGEVRGESFGEVFVNLYKNGVAFSGGGVFAIILGVPLLFLGRFGATLIIILAVLVCVLLIVNIPLPELFERIGGFFRNVGENVAERNERRREEAAIANEEYRRIQQEKQLKRQQEEQLRREQRRRAELAERENERERKLADMRDVVNSVGKPSDEPESPRSAFEMPEPMSPKRERNIKLPEREQAAELIREQKQDSRDYQQALKKYMEKRHPIMRDPEPPAPDKFEDGDADLVPIIDALDKLNAEKGPARVSKIVDAPKNEITDSDKLTAETSETFGDISDVDEAELPFDLDDIINENRELEGNSGFVEPPSPKAEQPVEIAPFGSEPFKTAERQVTLSEVYTLPPMNLLNPVKKPVQQADIDVEIRRNADKLVETLKSFGVQTTYLGASRGPSVTRYELQPAPGVKISKISNLADDVALNLAVSGVRIAPVPNKAAVGIEIPNKIKDTVFFRELVDTPDFKKSFDKKLETVLGKDISGNSVTCNITKMPHLLIAGTTGSGKSVCVNSLIMSILMKSTPDDVRLIMVDPKQVEFMMYNGIPHLLIPVVTEPKKAAGALAWAVTEMERRYTLFSENNVRNIDGYNDAAKNDDELERMPHIVIFIDELADLMMASPKDVEDSIVRLAQKARAAGMHLVIATQKPTVQVVTGLIKGNIPSRIALLVSSNIDSRVILDASGAEKLLGNGDMLYMPVGVQKPIRLQGCYVSDDEVERVAEFITQTFRAEYDEGIMAEIERQAEIVSSNDKSSAPDNDAEDGDDRDDKLDDAIEFVVTAGQASTSALQRHLKLGYGRAARIIDTMEKMGVVGPYEGSKPRQVLMTKQEWYERKLRS